MDQRRNVYFPLSLVEQIEPAKTAGRLVNVSEAAQRGIAAALNGHQAASR